MSYADIIVAGAGSSSVNGTYTHTGTANSKPLYGMGASYDIRWSGTAWQIRGFTFLIYYQSSDDVATPDLVTTWTLGASGTNPVPTVTESEDPAPSTDTPSTDTPPSIGDMAYSVFAKWGSTDYDYSFNEADRLLRYTVDRGRETIFGSGINSYDIGVMRLELDNYDGRYDPWNVDSPLYGHIKPGVEVRMRMAYESTSHILFTGQLEDVQQQGYKQTAVMVINDGWRWLRDQDYSRGPTIPTSFSNVFSTPLADYPWDTDISTSTDVPSFHFYNSGSLKGYIESIAQGSLGRAYVRNDGVFGFRALGDTDTATYTITEDIVLRNIYLPTPWDNYRSEINLTGYKGDVSETSDVIIDEVKNENIFEGLTRQISFFYAYENPYPLPATDTLEITVYGGWDGTDPVIPSSDYDWCIYRTYSDRVRVSITNNTPGTTFKSVRAYYGVDAPNIITSDEWTYETTDTDMRQAELTISSPWLFVQQTTDGPTASDETLIDDVGNTLLAYLSVVRPYPVIQLQGRYDQQLNIDLEDKVTLSFAHLSVSGDYRVTKISHESIKGTQDVITSLWLYPVMERST